MKSRISTCFPVLGLIFAASVTSAQVFPSFPTPVAFTQVTVEQGVSAASVPNSVYTTALLSVFVDSTSQYLGYEVSKDGENLTTAGYASTVPAPNCNAATPSTCSAAIALFNGKIYVAYSDASTFGLDVVIATPQSGFSTYTFATTHTDTTVKLTTAPTMALSPDGSRLIVMYGTKSDPNTSNQFFESTLNKSNVWTAASEGGGLSSLRLSSAQRPGMSVLNGSLFLCSQQNNSNHQLFVYKSVDGINWTFVVQDTALALGSGASMVTFDGSLVLVNEQNNSNRALFVFSSKDGTNWSAMEYSAIRMNGDPAIALYNSGVSLAFRGDNSPAFYGSFASH